MDSNFKFPSDREKMDYMTCREVLGGEAFMRIWDLPVSVLCNNHLLGEHHELHTIWSVVSNGQERGWARHPETKRWKGKLSALFRRHESEVIEMDHRGFQHLSPLIPPILDCMEQDVLIDSIHRQEALLYNKPCNCKKNIIVEGKYYGF